MGQVGVERASDPILPETDELPGVEMSQESNKRGVNEARVAVYLLSLTIFSTISSDGTNAHNIAASPNIFQRAAERTFQEKGSRRFIESFVNASKMRWGKTSHRCATGFMEA